MLITDKDIAKIRSSLGMTPTEFAAMLKVSESTVSRWESGKSHPRYNMMARLSDLANEKGIELGEAAEPVKA